MLALAPSRGWNYHGTNNGTTITVSLYANPNLVNGVRALTGAAVSGAVPTAITSSTDMYANMFGALGFTQDANNDYNVVTELSVGSAGAVPGSPLFVQPTLALNQTWTPYPGATATVIAVGAMPNASACPTSTTGAQVRYTYGGYDYSIAYVPGCGMTDIKNNANGAELSLISVASYPSIGQLSTARRAETLTLWDTAQSLLGLRRTAMPAAMRVAGFVTP